MMLLLFCLRAVRTLIFIIFICFSFSVGVALYLGVVIDTDLSSIALQSLGKPSIVLDDQGNELMRFQLDRREPIQLHQVPAHLINAFISAEDWQFFNHTGISIKGIIRSTFVNLYHRKRMQGASTITQQMVKLLFLDSKKTFSRKIKEQIAALLIEYRCSKEQILQIYLNSVYFGCGIYGVQAACQRFFNCNVGDITVDQAAMLAGIVRSPGRYCPLSYPLCAHARRDIVLHQMCRLGYINEEARHFFTATTTMITPSLEDIFAAHIKEMVREEIKQHVEKKSLYTGGLIIQTTINAQLQRDAEKSFVAHMMHLRDSMQLPIDGALITIEGETGGIKALVGGYDFKESKFNRVQQAKRQLGSIFKPIVYAAAIEQGYNFSHTEIDEPFEMMVGASLWAPTNYNKQFKGQMTLAHAIAHSNNIVAIKMLLRVGVEKVLEVAQRMHMSTVYHTYPSLALGCVDVSLLDATAYFNIFSHDGIYVKPYLIAWIKDDMGVKKFYHTVSKDRVLKSCVAGQVGKVLEIGFNRAKRMLNIDMQDVSVMSKTGTTNDARTCWFIGSTPTLTTGLYVGLDDNRSMGKNIYPVHTALPIWSQIHVGRSEQKKSFSYAPELKEILIDGFTGELVDRSRPGALSILVER